MRAALLVAIFFSTFVAILLPVIGTLVQSGGRGKAAREKALARRAAEHRMDARLLRFNL
jgi:hypothetical protein